MKYVALALAVCLSVFLSVHFAYLPICLFACLPACLLTDLPACLLTDLPANLLAYPFNFESITIPTSGFSFQQN
jgi:hypothetical protein